jgi:hypothetical protein
MGSVHVENRRRWEDNIKIGVRTRIMMILKFVAL